MSTVDKAQIEAIDSLIASLTDWRGPMLSRIRQIIHEADPEVVEEWKYMGSPCWSHDGLMAVGNAFKNQSEIGFSGRCQPAGP